MTALTPRTDRVEAKAYDHNYIINGNFDFWQRNSGPYTAPTSNLHAGPDRWREWGSGTGTRQTITRSTTVPNSESRYSMKVTGTTTATSHRIVQRIEADNCRSLVGKKATISLYIRNDTGVAITPQVRIATADADDNFSSATEQMGYTNMQECPNSAWTKVSLTMDFSGMSNIANGIEIMLSSGATLNTTGKSISYAQVMLNEGEFAASFRRHSTSIQCELSACQRYFQRYGGTGAYNVYGCGTTWVSTKFVIAFQFITSMRDIPTISTNGSFRGYASNSDIHTVTLSVDGNTDSIHGVGIDCSGTGMTVGSAYNLQNNNDTSAYIDFNAEL